MPKFSWQNKPKGGLTFNIPQPHAQVGSILQGQFKCPVLPEVFPTFQIPGLFLLSPPPQLPWCISGTTWLGAMAQPILPLAGLPGRACSSLGDPCLPAALTPWLLMLTLPFLSHGNHNKDPISCCCLAPSASSLTLVRLHVASSAVACPLFLGTE